MKGIKKGLLLAFSFAMSMTLFAACGGSGDNSGNGGSGDNGGNVQGEQLADAMAWAQAWNDSVSSTNATATFSFTIESRQGALFEKDEASGTYKVADGKYHGLLTERESWNLGDGDVGDEEWTEEWYVGAVDGTWYEWDKDFEANEWLEEDFYVTEGMTAENYTTVYGILYELEVPYEPFYTEYESFTYTDGTYVSTMTAGSFTRTASLKFAGGKLVSYEMIVLANEDGQTSSGKMQVTFTYGNTTIGALPGQEDVEDGDSSEIIKDSAEIIDSSSETVENSSESVENSSNENGGGDAVGGQVDEAGWNAALSLADTDYEYMQSEGGMPIVTYKIDGDTVYISQPMMERYYTIEDGSYYIYENRECSGWTKNSLSKDEYTAYVDMVKIDWNAMFSYSDFTYNAETGCYEAASVNIGGETTLTNVAVKISNGKLLAMSYTAEGMNLALAFTYHEITLTLPEVNGGEVGGDTSEDDAGNGENGGDEIVTPDVEIALPEKFKVEVDPTDVVTQEEWEKAVRASVAATNFRMYCLYESNNESWQSIADGKGSHRAESADGSFMYSYVGKVDGIFYTWISTDGKNWSCQQAQEFPLSGEMFFGSMVDLLAYSNAVYDEEKGLYTVTGSFMEGDTIVNAIVEVIVNDGKIVSVNGVDGVSGLYQFSYGDAYVGKLPPVMENNNGGAGNSGTTTDKNDNVTDDNGGMTDDNGGMTDNNGGMTDNNDNNDNNGNNNDNGTDTDDNAPQPSNKVVTNKVTNEN